MKNDNNELPSADFFDFETYNLPNEDGFSLDSNLSKPILVYLNNAKAEEVQLLGKILQAVNRDMGKDAYVINESTGSNKLPSLKTILKIVDLKKVLVFGFAPKDIGLNANINAYQLFNFQNRQFLFSHNLETISSDLNRKKELWAQLQLMFS